MKRLPLTAGLLLAISSSLAVLADSDHLEARRLMESGAILPLEQIMDSIRERWPGRRILEVELENEHGDYLYEIELLDNQGSVWELEIDATNGRLLKTEEDD